MLLLPPPCRVTGKVEKTPPSNDFNADLDGGLEYHGEVEPRGHESHTSKFRLPSLDVLF